MEKWRIQSSVVEGIGRVYRAVRIINPDEAVDSDNVEVYGQWCEEREAVAATVRHLNEQEGCVSYPNETLKTCICPICGAKFVPTSEWHWTNGRFKFCRYHCYLKRHLLDKPKSNRRERRVRQLRLDGELVAIYRNASEAARAIGYPVSTIRACCNKHQPLGTGFRFEYVREEVTGDAAEEPEKGTPLSEA